MTQVTVNSDSGSRVGGLVGLNLGGTVTNSYWDTESTNQSSSDGSATGLTTSEMQGSTPKDSTMTNFDWTNVWTTVNGDYPVLQWQNENS